MQAPATQLVRDGSAIGYEERGRCDHNVARYTAAKAAFASGRHEEAAALFGQLLLTGAPEPHLVLCNRSAAWAKLGKWAEAEGDARLAMASSPPSFVKAPYGLACALQGCGRLDEVRSWGSGQASAAPVSHGPFLSRSSAP